MAEYHDFIKPTAIEAGKLVYEGFYGEKKVEQKSNFAFDLVTDIDKKVEELLSSKIKAKYPDHIIIGEETYVSGTKITLTDSPTWIIDPVDGTINFVRGIPFIGISIALAIQKEVVLGIVYNPVTDHFFHAVKGKGAYCNETRIYSSKQEEFNKCIVCNELSLASIPVLRERTLERVQKATEVGFFGFRSFGSAALTLCYVANGSLDAYFTDGLQCWDVAAGVFILEEAGGCAANPNGERFDMFSRVILVAGNKVILNKMVELLKECDEKTTKNLKPEIASMLKNK